MLTKNIANKVNRLNGKSKIEKLVVSQRKHKLIVFSNIIHLQSHVSIFYASRFNTGPLNKSVPANPI